MCWAGPGPRRLPSGPSSPSRGPGGHGRGGAHVAAAARLLSLAVLAVTARAAAGAAPLPPPEGARPASALACASEPLPAHGIVYYACDCGPGADARCVPGADDARGTRPDRPWRTYQKVREAFGGLRPGDAVAFCKGGSFDASAGGAWLNDRCRAERPCTIRDYAPPWANGSERRPVLRSAGRHLFDFANPGDAHHREGVRILNLRLQGTGAGWGLFFFNDIDDVTACNLEIDGFEIGIHVGGANPPGPGSDGRNQRIQVLGSRILNCSGNGFLGGCDGCAVRDNLFWNDGGEDMFRHAVYFGGTGAGERIVGNVIHAPDAGGAGVCKGTVVVVHGQHEGLLIEGNQIVAEPGRSADGCWGLSVTAGYDHPERFRDLVIRGNVIRNAGNTLLSVMAAPGAIIENNVLVSEVPRETVGIAAPHRAHRTNIGAAGRDDAVMDRVTVRNNSVYFGPEAFGEAIHVGVEGIGHVVVSNAVQLAGKGRASSCFRLELPAAAYDAVDHNVCGYAGPPGAWEVSTAARDLADWRRKRPGFDGGSREADPRFTHPPDDLSPAAGSPLSRAGSPMRSAPTDATGKRRDERPDAGAYER